VFYVLREQHKTAGNGSNVTAVSIGYAIFPEVLENIL
jgi:hypothetical protein